MPINENDKAKAPEKSNFTRRCTLLSRYLKEKGSFGNIDLRLPGKSDPPGDQNAMYKAENSETKPNEFYQKVTKAEPSTSSGGMVKEAELSNSETGSSQLTIFFGGQVLVFNEFPVDKAKEIMQVAKEVMPKINIQTVQTNVQNNNNNNSKSNSVLPAEINVQTQANVNNNNKRNLVLPDLNEPTNSTDINQEQQNQVVERIARRASLHRFFAKRKDRAVARAPYQVNQNAGDHLRFPPKPEMVAGQPIEQGQSSQRRDNVIPQTVTHPKPESDKDMSMKIEEDDQSSKDLELKL